jgi:hypothetical protein
LRILTSHAESLPPAAGGDRGVLYASRLTRPAGGAWLGNHLWVADSRARFCRVEGRPGFATARSDVGTPPGLLLSPGQPTYDPRHRAVYLPDNARRGRGLWRLRFDPQRERLGDLTLIAPGLGIAAVRPTASALGPDGRLYLGGLNGGAVLRVDNPAGARQTVERIGRSLKGGWIGGLAFVGSDLYLAERDGLSLLREATGEAAERVAARVPHTSPWPTTAALNDGQGSLFTVVPAMGAVLRLGLVQGVQEVLAASGTLEDGTVAPFVFSRCKSAGLALAPGGHLLVFDDPGRDLFDAQGRIWLLPLRH